MRSGETSRPPFNRSTTVFYINKDAFKKAGLDPEKPPKASEEVAALRTRLNSVEAERAKERETNLRLERESDLRRSLSRPELNVINVDAAMRMAMPDLKVGSDNRFYRDDAQRGAVPVDDFTAELLKANPWMQKPSGRSGSGGTPPGASGGGQQVTMTGDDYKAKLRTLNEDQRDAWRTSFFANGGVVKG